MKATCLQVQEEILNAIKNIKNCTYQNIVNVYVEEVLRSKDVVTFMVTSEAWCYYHTSHDCKNGNIENEYAYYSAIIIEDGLAYQLHYSKDDMGEEMYVISDVESNLDKMDYPSAIINGFIDSIVKYVETTYVQINDEQVTVTWDEQYGEERLNYTLTYKDFNKACFFIIPNLQNYKDIATQKEAAED